MTDQPSLLLWLGLPQRCQMRCAVPDKSVVRSLRKERCREWHWRGPVLAVGSEGRAGAPKGPSRLLCAGSPALCSGAAGSRDVPPAGLRGTDSLATSETGIQSSHSQLERSGVEELHSVILNCRLAGIWYF